MLNMSMSALLSCSLIDIRCSRKNSLAAFLIMNNFSLRKVHSKSSLALRVCLTKVSKSCVINLTCVSLANCTCEFARGTGIRLLWCSSFQTCCSVNEAPGVDWQPLSLKALESTYFNIQGHAHYISNLVLLFLVLLPSHLHKACVSELARVTSLYLQCWWRTLRYVLYCEQPKESERFMEVSVKIVSTNN